MPIPVGPAIQAGAGLVGDTLGFFGGKGAQRAQERATQQALELERQQQAEEKRRWEIEQQMAERKSAEDERRWNLQWEAGAGGRAARESILAKYGIRPGPTDYANPYQRPDVSGGSPYSMGQLVRGMGDNGEEFDPNHTYRNASPYSLGRVVR